MFKSKLIPWITILKKSRIFLIRLIKESVIELFENQLYYINFLDYITFIIYIKSRLVTELLS